MFLFLNEIIEIANIITKYIAQIVIENSTLVPLNIGVPPNRYWLKSQLGVTKYFTKSHLYVIASILIISLPIYPNIGKAIASGEFKKIVLSANAKVPIKINIGNLHININPKYANIFSVTILLLVKSNSQTCIA